MGLDGTICNWNGILDVSKISKRQQKRSGMAGLECACGVKRRNNDPYSFNPITDTTFSTNRARIYTLEYFYICSVNLEKSRNLQEPQTLTVPKLPLISGKNMSRNSFPKTYCHQLK